MPISSSCPCAAHTLTLPPHITAPSALAICHCISCQRRTGSAFHIGAIFLGTERAWLNLPEGMMVTTTSADGGGGGGATTEFVGRQGDGDRDKDQEEGRNGKVTINSWTAESGNVVERAFCKECGGTVAMWHGRKQQEDSAVRGKEEEEEEQNKKRGEGEGEGGVGGQTLGQIPVFTIPAPNLRDFDWGGMMREDKQRVFHCWTKCAVVGEGLWKKDGQVAFAEQASTVEDREVLGRLLGKTGEGERAIVSMSGRMEDCRS